MTTKARKKFTRSKIPVLVSLIAFGAASAGLLTVGARQAAAADPWTIVTTAVDVVQKLYSANDWVNCKVFGQCPPSEVVQQADAIMDTLANLTLRTAYGHFAPDTKSLFDRMVRAYSQPSLLSHDQEVNLVDDAENLLNDLSAALDNTSPTSGPEVEEAYQLATTFTVLAATVDQIFRSAMSRGVVDVPSFQLTVLRAEVLQTEYNLVGGQATWFDCSNSGVPPFVMVDTVSSYDNAFPTKKLWKKFADQKFSLQWCQNNCDIFRRVTNPQGSMCSEDCPSYSILGTCVSDIGKDGCIAALEPEIYAMGLPKATAAMNRDPVVRSVRAGMESLLKMDMEDSIYPSESYCGVNQGMLFTPGFGGYETWRTAGFQGTHGTLAGDVDGDGKTDLIALNDNNVTLIRSYGTTFGSVEVLVSYPFYGSHGTLAGDVDGDGAADLVGMGDGYVGVFRPHPSIGKPNNGALGGGGVYENWSTATFYGTHGTFLADVNGDGKADLVALNDANVTVMLSTGSSFSAPAVWSGAFYGNVTNLVGDVDGDGRADLVQLSQGGGGPNVRVSLSTGGAFGNVVDWWPGTFFGSHGNLLADIDGDGRADLVGLGDGYVGVIRSTGRSFGAYENWWAASFYSTVATPTWLTDLDGNGKADLVGTGVGYVGAIRSQ